MTSSVALASPTIAFLQEEFNFTRRKAARAVTALALGLGLFHVIFYRHGVLGEWDYWAGTFGLVVFAAIEIILFAWIFGIDRGWDQLHEGADIRIPGVYKVIMKWVTPVFLYGLLIWWTIDEAIPTLLMDTVEDPATIPYRWVSRLLMVGLVALGALLIRKAWKRNGRVA